MCEKLEIQKKDYMCIGKENVDNILSYVDYSRLRNAIFIYPELSPEFLTNGIHFTLSNSERATERRKMLLVF